ncbi:MAG: FAD-dependent thymidylate synthase, partial [Nitrosopumilus sp.]
MSEITDITVHCIAHTSLNHVAIQEWLWDIGVDEFKLPSEPSEAECLVGLAAKRCYMSFEVGLNPNVTKIRKNWFDYLTNILASGHGSVLEHASYTFAIDGVSRVFTAEMNRHRAGVAISEGSMRYIKLNNLKYWLPTSISDNNDQQRETRAVFK